MTVQEAKWYLRSVRSMRVKVRTLENSKEAAWEHATKTTPCMDPTGIRSTSEHDLMSQYLIDVDDLNQEIINSKIQIRKAEHCIFDLEDPRYVAVLHCYYIDAMTWDQTAKILHFSVPRQNGKSLLVQARAAAGMKYIDVRRADTWTARTGYSNSIIARDAGQISSALRKGAEDMNTWVAKMSRMRLVDADAPKAGKENKWS